MNNNLKQLWRDMAQSWWRGVLPTVLPREVNLSRLFDPKIKKILSVTGFRRSGKTFTLFAFAREYGQNRCVYFNFEDERLPKRTEVLTILIKVLEEIRGREPLVLLLDEIQEIPNWSQWARRINETTPHRIIITGSSSKLSSQEIPTELRGQALTTVISPLSWREYLWFKKKNPADLLKEEILYLLRDYLKFGGLPEVVLAEEGLKPLLLDEYYQTFVQRDLIERYKIRNRNVLQDLLRLAIGTRAFTYSNFTNTLKSLGHKVGKATVINYLRAAQKTYFLNILELGSPNVKRRLQATKKLYCADTFFFSRYASTLSENLGHLMEQAVFLELWRRITKDKTRELFYWKDYSGREVDFLEVRNTKPENLYQVVFAEGITAIPKRERESLYRAARKLGCQSLTMITWDVQAEEKKNDLAIKFIPLSEWLLAPF